MNTLAESESTLQSSRGPWKHLEALRSTGVGYLSIWEVCVAFGLIYILLMRFYVIWIIGTLVTHIALSPLCFCEFAFSLPY
jgi:hypothetical protein